MIRAQQIRLDKHLTVAQLAEKAGVSIPTVYRLEKTGRVGTVESLHKIAAALEVKNASTLLAPAVFPERDAA